MDIYLSTAQMDKRFEGITGAWPLFMPMPQHMVEDQAIVVVENQNGEGQTVVRIYRKGFNDKRHSKLLRLPWKEVELAE